MAQFFGQESVAGLNSSLSNAVMQSMGNGNEDPIKKKKEQASKLLSGRLLNDNNRTAKDVIVSAANKTGIDPLLLAASSLQEGMDQMISDNINKPQEGNWLSEAYDFAGYDPKFPVDGFYYYGLDTFGDRVESFKEKGYIPKDFEYKPFKAKNEKGQWVNTGAFKSNEDALVAKAAFIKDLQDQVREYSKRKGVTLDKDTENYLTMSAYNGGFGNAKIMMDELASGGYKQKDFVSKGLTSRKGVHKNVAPRMERIGMMSEFFTESPMPPSGGLAGAVGQPVAQQR